MNNIDKDNSVQRKIKEMDPPYYDMDIFPKNKCILDTLVQGYIEVNQHKSRLSESIKELNINPASEEHILGLIEETFKDTAETAVNNAKYLFSRLSLLIDESDPLEILEIAGIGVEQENNNNDIGMKNIEFMHPRAMLRIKNFVQKNAKRISTLKRIKDDPKSIRSLLHKYKEKTGKKRADISKDTGISLSSLKAIEDGKNFFRPSMAQVLNLAAILETDASEIALKLLDA